MAENVIHTIIPGATINLGYFDEDNITFIQRRIGEILLHEFVQWIDIDRASIVRTMQYILSQRREIVPKMNQRVIMSICNEFRNHQNEVNKVLVWEQGYVQSQRNID